MEAGGSWWKLVASMAPIWHFESLRKLALSALRRELKLLFTCTKYRAWALAASGAICRTTVWLAVFRVQNGVSHGSPEASRAGCLLESSTGIRGAPGKLLGSSLPCSWHAPGTLLAHSQHAPDMLLACSWHAPGTLLACSCHAPATLLERSWHAPGMLLPCSCHGLRLRLSMLRTCF